ncbi:MAG: ROK family protein, partial [Cellulomonadaceae bacterium]|nr:ROK family protein [Cellulomonadaceae bacterium]
GYILEGKLRRGYGVVGEVGHIPINANGPKCQCGQRGCLELYASGSALASKWPANGAIPGPQALLQAANRGDKRANDILCEFYQAVAISVRNIILGIGPQAVIIGGGVTRLGEPMLLGVRSALDDLCVDSAFLKSLNMPGRVTLIEPGAPVAAIGAAVLAAEI